MALLPFGGVPPKKNVAGSGITVTNGATTSTIALSSSLVPGTPPTLQTFSSGSGTYTPTSASVLWIRVRLVGGGGGGGGAIAAAAGSGGGGGGGYVEHITTAASFSYSVGAAGSGGAGGGTGNNGGTGGTTTFGTLSATGGGGGAYGQTTSVTPAGGAGGVGSGGNIANSVGQAGGYGYGEALPGGIESGGVGGSSVLGGGGLPGTGSSAAPGGAGSNGGGGGGTCVGQAGGSGGSGLIIVEEYYAVGLTTSTGITRSVNTISANTTAGAAASTDYVYIITTAGVTLTLPTAVGNTNKYTVKNKSTGTVFVATTSSQTIDGSSSPISIVEPSSTLYPSLDLISDGSNWDIT